MKRTRSKPPGPPAPFERRLSGIRSLAHHEDERPSREDLTSGETIFNRAVVPLPRWLTGKRN
jgi:hypothetical protein